jgi:alanyl-tRNA synthetase
MATARLYYSDAYLTAFDARVVEHGDEGARVYLDQTAFYPSSGGQPHDLGTLGGIDIVDVIDEGERVAHVLASPLPGDRRSVAGRVDWMRRFDHMQQHTGQHLLSALLDERYGHATLSVHFGVDYSTVDVDAESISPARLVELERLANATVLENREVMMTLEDAATTTGLRKASDRTGVLRIISIEGIDRSACGGTHVRRTSEIGPILLRGTERVRGGTRIIFLCGLRAIARARADFEQLTRIAASLSSSVDDAVAVVSTQAERLRESDGARRKLEKELAAFQARALYENTRADAGGVRTIVLTDSAATMDELRALAQAVIALPKTIVVGTLARPASVLLASSDDSSLDAGRTLKEALSAVGGRGGGSPRLAQGSVPDSAAADAVVARIVNRAG